VACESCSGVSNLRTAIHLLLTYLHGERERITGVWRRSPSGVQGQSRDRPPYTSPCKNSSDLYQFQERPLAKVRWTRPPRGDATRSGPPYKQTPYISFYPLPASPLPASGHCLRCPPYRRVPGIYPTVMSFCRDAWRATRPK